MSFTSVQKLDFLHSLRALMPGILTATTIAMAANYLSDHYNGPVMVFALLLGMAFYFLSQEGKCSTGIDFSSKRILRIGVALLGAKITADQLLQLGAGTLLLVLAAVLLTIGFGFLLGRFIGRDSSFGVLSGGAVAICGASAALAIASVMPKSARAERNTIFTVISVTTLSTIAMIVYPLVASYLNFNDTQTGIFLGSTIHDVAQVVGAGYSVSEQTGDASTLTKLLRVSLLLPIILAISLFFSLSSKRSGKTEAIPFPFFLLGFIALAAINSLGLIPETPQQVLGQLSKWCLVISIAALGMKTSIKAMLDVGGWPMALIVMETLFLAILVIGAIKLWF